MSGFFAPRALVRGLVNCTCAGTLNFLRAQLGHRMETGSLEAAEKWTEELQSVSLPCLMCLQVPLKTGEASEMERRKKRESSNIWEEKVLENVEALLKNMERWMCVCVCVCVPVCVYTVQSHIVGCSLQIFYRVISEMCFYQINVYFECQGRGGMVHNSQSGTEWGIIGLGGSICHQKENSHICKSFLEQNNRRLSGSDFEHPSKPTTSEHPMQNDGIKRGNNLWVRKGNFKGSTSMLSGVH